MQRGMAKSAQSKSPAPLPAVVAEVMQASQSELTFAASIKKMPGMSIGIDVTYSSASSWSRHGVFISQISKDGLIAAWNTRSEEPNRAQPGDFVFQVNEVHGNTQQILQEMKMKADLVIHILRPKKSPDKEKAAEATAEALAVAPPLGIDVVAEAAAPFAAVSQVRREELQDTLLALDEEALVDFVYTALDRRPWLRSRVLEQQLPVQSQSEFPDVYLPKIIDGQKVLVEEKNGRWRVTPSKDYPGIAFRASKRLDDLIKKGVDRGQVVDAVDEGDGWVRCQNPNARAAAGKPKSGS